MLFIIILTIIHSHFLLYHSLSIILESFYNYSHNRYLNILLPTYFSTLIPNTTLYTFTPNYIPVSDKGYVFASKGPFFHPTFIIIIIYY